MRSVRFLFMILALASMSSTAAQAAGLPSWCPWGCGAKHTSAMPVVSVANRGAASSPAVITKINSGTKRLVSNTKNLLTFNKPSAAGTSSANYSTTRKPKEPGFFYKLFHPEPPLPPQTVKEWMSLEQIRP